VQIGHARQVLFANDHRARTVELTESAFVSKNVENIKTCCICVIDSRRRRFKSAPFYTIKPFVPKPYAL